MARPFATSFDPSRLTKTAAEEYSSSASDSEDEYLLPGLGSDENEFGEFNPRKRRKLGGNNKEKAALGIFGSDSDDDGSRNRWKKKTLRSKGMSFVAKTAEEDAQSDKNKKEEGSSKEDRPVWISRDMDADDDEDEDENEGIAGVGLGFRRMAPGLATTSPSGVDSGSEHARANHAAASFGIQFDGSNALGRGFVPSSDSVPVLKEPQNGSTNPPQNMAHPSAFGPNSKAKLKSFGARMMAKMGYVEGEGLGKDRQGRNVIIEANLRPQGIGLGAVKEKSEHERQEEKRQARLRGDQVMDSDEEDKQKRKKDRKKTLGSGSNTAASTPRRQKTKFLTAEELKATAPGLHIPDAFSPILDMTGPAGKILMSTSGVMTPTGGVADSAEVIERRKLVKHAHSDLLAFSEEWKTLEERKKWADLELEGVRKELDDLRSDSERLEAFLSLLTTELVPASEWDHLINCLSKAVGFGSTHPEISDLVVAAIHPYMRDADWDPLAQPEWISSDLKGIRDLLWKSGDDKKAVRMWKTLDIRSDDTYRKHVTATTSYESIMYKIWLPKVLAAVRSWDPYDPAPMLTVMEHWDELLPPFVRVQLMDSIARKLESTLSDWNPRKKRQSHHLPHTWLFPWMQFLPPYHLDPRGTGLVADVRRKFRHLIDVWEFERGLIPGFKAWEEVLGPQWRPLIMSHVLPSMGKYLRGHFHVDPADQEPSLPVLTGILEWHQVLGDALLSEVLEQHLFPMWSNQLQEWLSLEEADLGEVADWYSWWRDVLLKELSHLRSVRVELDKGVKTMNVF